MKRRLMALLLALLGGGMLSLSACSSSKPSVDPHEAGTCSCWVTGTVEVFTEDGIRVSYAAYKDSYQSNYHPHAVEVTDESFPIRVVLHSAYTMNTVERTIESYGTHFFNFKELRGDEKDSYKVVETLPRSYYGANAVYATLNIVQCSESQDDASECPESAGPEESQDIIASETPEVSTNPDNAVATKPLTTEYDEEIAQLIGGLDLPDFASDNTPYRMDLAEFLAGEWDGSQRESTVDGWTIKRNLMTRTYYWWAVNDATQEEERRQVNIDYVGELEVVPSLDWEFSLVANPGSGAVTQWRNLEIVGFWAVTEVAPGETIDSVMPMPAAEDIHDVVATVSTVDADGESHCYDLLAGGKISKVF